MPTNTYTPLATITLASTDSEIVFASIPATYRDLILVFNGDGNSGGADISIRLNGDTGANYNRVWMNGNGSVTASGANSNVNEMDAQTVANGRRLNMIVNIMDASATDKHKTALVRDDDPGFVTDARVFRWANTARVTSVTMFTSAGSFIVGSTFSLYGVIA
jgi:hypothetical protein